MSSGESAQTPVVSQTNPPHHILVVEDEILIRQLNTAALLHAGYDVNAARDGADAWEALNSGLYDLVITDNNMPKVSGVELLKKMRAARIVLPVIMATGELPQEAFTRYPWLQPEAILLKPYAVEEMLRTVKKVLREADCAADSSHRFMFNALNDNEPSPAGDPAGVPQTGPANFPHRILVVDEDSDLCRLYAEALTNLACQVDAAQDGAAGWEALQANRYHLLITENNLPKLTGLELIEKLRAARMSLPVVMAARRLPTDELALNPVLQLAATLAKPFAVNALLETVQTALRVADTSPRELAPAGEQRPPSAGGLQR